MPWPATEWTGLKSASANTGQGIDPESQPRLFEPFFTGFDVSHHSSGTFDMERRGSVWGCRSSGHLSICTAARFESKARWGRQHLYALAAIRRASDDAVRDCDGGRNSCPTRLPRMQRNSSLLGSAVRFYWVTARLIAVLAISVGTVILLGWRFDIPSLKTVFPGLAAMNPTTAAGFMLGGISLLLLSSAVPVPKRRRRAGCRDSHDPDRCTEADLPPARAGSGNRPPFLPFYQVAANPMAPNTALCFVLCGTALLTIDVRLRQGVRREDASR